MEFRVLAIGDVTSEEGTAHLRRRLPAFKRDRRVDFTVINGENISGTGLTARCFCHEIDHLEGVVFTSRADRMLTDEELECGSWMEEENGEDEVE